MLDFYQALAEGQGFAVTVRDFLKDQLEADFAAAWDKGTFPAGAVTKLGQQGYLGAAIPEAYGGSELDPLSYGILMYQLERVDSGLRSFVSVQGALCAHAILAYGSEEQRQRYLPGLARGELIGCFGLTEPQGGSDPGAMQTQVARTQSGYRLHGRKLWITNGAIADIAVIWARDPEGKVAGFIVPTNSPGFLARPVGHKMSMRASVTSELVLEGVELGEEARLPGAKSLGAPLSCLTEARYGIAWGALGALEAVYREALAFAQTRSSFGNSLASRQLVQQKLVQLVSDHTKGLLLVRQLAALKAAGRLNFAQVSLAKRDNVRAALQGARAAREILGAAGITTDHAVIRHLLNLETVDTYEGTFDVQTLILGRELTGEAGF